MKKYTTDTTQLALLVQDMGYVKRRIDAIDIKLDSKYVRKEEFEPVKKIVFGLVALTLTAVIGTLMSIVLK